MTKNFAQVIAESKRAGDTHYARCDNLAITMRRYMGSLDVTSWLYREESGWKMLSSRYYSDFDALHPDWQARTVPISCNTPTRKP